MGPFKWLVLVVAAAAVLAAVPAAGSARPSKAGVAAFSPRHGSIGGIVPARGAPKKYVQGSGDLTYHGGPVMRTNQTYAIYWAPSGFSLPTGYESTINQYFTDVAHDDGGNQNVYGILNQYYDGTGNIAYNSTFAGAVVDTNAYPASGCTDAPYASVCLTDAQLQKEIKAVVAAQGWPHTGTAEYFMLTPPNVGSCFDGTSSTCSYSYFCAYHGSFTVTGGEEIYSNMPYAGVPQCDEGQYPNGNTADATINVMSHEHSESITDPNLNAWYDAAGYEIGDKCAWDFGTLSGSPGAEYNETINSHHYFMQREYDNSTHACLQRPAGPTQAVVTSVKPSALGQGASQAKVTIKGSKFASGATVSVSGSGVTVNSVTFVSSIQLTAKLSVSSSATPGTYNVSVTNPGASAGTCTGCLTVDLGPVVSSTLPSSGARGTTESVKVLGSNFVSGVKVKINSRVNVTSTTFVSSGEIDITVSISATAKVGGRTVTVTNPDKGVGTLANGFSVTS